MAPPLAEPEIPQKLEEIVVNGWSEVTVSLVDVHPVETA
jgi:hypothetical protein